MNKRDELIALIDAYAHHVRGWQRIDPTYRENIITTLEAALTPGEPAAVFDEMLGRPVLVEGAPLLAHGQVLYTAAPPAQTPLEIRAPNGSGEATCIIRWMAETPNGWVGSFRREALEQFSAPAQTPPPRLTDSDRQRIFSLAEKVLREKGDSSTWFVLVNETELLIRAKLGIKDQEGGAA